MPQASLFKVKISEAEVQKTILQYLRMRGVYCWRQNAGSFKVGDRFVSMGMKGISDVLAIYPHGIRKGTLVALEIKKEKGLLSDSQIVFLKDVRKSGAIAMVAESLDDVIRLLDDPNAKSAERYEKLLG